MAEFFNCLLLTRDDLKEVGFDAETLTDAQMERLAQKIGESCMEEFWASLEYFAEKYGLSKTEQTSLSTPLQRIMWRLEETQSTTWIAGSEIAVIRQSTASLAMQSAKENAVVKRRKTQLLLVNQSIGYQRVKLLTTAITICFSSYNLDHPSS